MCSIKTFNFCKPCLGPGLWQISYEEFFVEFRGFRVQRVQRDQWIQIRLYHKNGRNVPGTSSNVAAFLPPFFLKGHPHEGVFQRQISET